MVYTCEYEIKKDDFVAAGEASSQIKNKLKQIGVDAALIRKIAIEMCIRDRIMVSQKKRLKQHRNIMLPMHRRSGSLLC